MEQTFNVPIQMFCVISTVGDFTPVIFKFENNDHAIETIRINQILSHKDTNYNGNHEILYTCQAQIDGINHIFTLTYSVASHRWRFFKLLT